MGTDDSYSTIITNTDDLVTILADNLLSSFNLNISGGTDNNKVYIPTSATTITSGLTTGTYLDIDGNLFLVTGSTTVGDKKVYSGSNVNNDLNVISTFNYLPYGPHKVKIYNNLNKNLWFTKFYPYKNSITFSNEFDYDGNLRDKNLYKNYYEKFLTQLYSVNTRTWEFEGYLPDNLYYYLTLASTIKIGDKRFMIVDMSINLLTGKVSLKMINYTNYKLGSKLASGERTDVLNNLLKYNVYPSNRGIVLFNGLNKTIDYVSDGTTAQYNGSASINQTTYYIGNDIESFLVAYQGSVSTQNVNVYLVRYGEIIGILPLSLSGISTPTLSIPLFTQIKNKAIIGDIIMIMPR
jgi:hypothetical protein